MHTTSWRRAAFLCLSIALILGSSPSARSANAAVNIAGFAFSPNSVSINTGDSVTWTQHDSSTHTSTSDASPPLWSSPFLTANQTFSFTFQNAGTFGYHCALHSFMTGKVEVNAAATNAPPSVQITAPADNQLVINPAVVKIEATAADPDGSIAQVEFFDAGKSIGITKTAPFTLSLTNLVSGSHVFTAVATDNQGASKTSSAITIQVDDPPTVKLLAPVNGGVFIAPATFQIEADASDPEGKLAQLTLLSGTNLIGVTTQGPISVTWSNVPPGQYQFQAMAVDAQGAQTLSPVATITVTGAAAYSQQNLVSDIPGLAAHTDTNLVNPWGLAFSSSSPFWISDNHAGVSTLYITDGTPQSLIVTIPPPPSGTPPAAPTGVIFNNTTDFPVLTTTNTPARFIFATEDGTIAAWNSGPNAVLKVDNSASHAVYKGLTFGVSDRKNFLYAADFHNAKIDVFDSAFSRATLAGSFSDPALPKGYAPFNIRNLGGKLFVTYALQDADAMDDVSGLGNGFINIFDTSGHLLQRFASNGDLNSPWGLAIAPPGFGRFSTDLLVGNFGDGRIHAFDLASGQMHGVLIGTNDAPLAIMGLWDIAFGNGGRGGNPASLYFTAGIPGNDSVEDHGLFGSISATPVLQLSGAGHQENAITFQWLGGTPPFLLQKKNKFTETNWFNILTTSSSSATVPMDGNTGFYRVLDRSQITVIPFSVVMSGASETPSVAGNGSAVGILSLEGTQLHYHIAYHGLSGPAVAAHIHGPADLSHPAGVLFPLNGASAASGELSGTQTLTADQLAAMTSGMTYANIHTAANGGGEIRGQVLPLHLQAVLSGGAEVPAVTTSGSGHGDLTLIGSQLLYTVTFTNLSTPAIAAHIHGPADPSKSAGVIIPFPKPAGTAGVITSSQLLTTDELQEILSGLTYVNVHTTANPGGEIRGQIVPFHFTVSLNGNSEVPAVAGNGSGSGDLWLSGNTLTYSIQYSGLTSAAIAAHIHGTADTSHTAGVLFPLNGFAGTAGTLSGSQTLTADQLLDLFSGLTYANIHTTNNPGGEIRGQIIAAP